LLKRAEKGGATVRFAKGRGGVGGGDVDNDDDERYVESRRSRAVEHE
jgi:hypothetical protein